MRRTAPNSGSAPHEPRGLAPRASLSAAVAPGRVTRRLLHRLGYRFRLRPGPTPADPEQLVLRRCRAVITLRPSDTPPSAVPPPPPGWRALVVDPAEELDPVGLAARLDFELRAGLDARDPAAPDYLATR